MKLFVGLVVGAKVVHSCRSGFDYSGGLCHPDWWHDFWGHDTYDVNECSSNRCDHHCHNTWGSYYCSCNSGFRSHGRSCPNINECSERSHNCHQYADCDDRSPGFVCACRSGYSTWYSGATNQHSNACVDTDECSSPSLNTCHADAYCTNKQMHYHNKKYECTCNSGFYGDGHSCTDHNECTNGQKRCDPVAACTNTHGNHYCTCPTGYTDRYGDGSKCDDVDECANNPCSDNAVCTNTVGSYYCDCNEGYQGEGHDCTFCHEKSTWANTGDEDHEMEAVCTCITGWRGDGDLCEDIVECNEGEENDCDENAYCTNTVGSHFCTCNAGYYGFGKECTACDPETHLDEMVFECNTESISITVPYCAFYNEEITNASFLGGGENCTMENTGIDVEMSIPTSSECGTIIENNGTYLLYSNAIIGDVREHDGVVSRKKYIDVDFHCAFESDMDLTYESQIHAMIDHVDITLDRQDKEFDIQMGVFTDETFSELVPDDYSIVVPDIIHAGIELMDGEEALVLLAEKCWATPTSDPEDETQYVFLDNFCSSLDVDGLFSVGQNGISRNAQFELRSFEFDGHLDGIIYLHCHANVCDTEIEDCSIDCSDSGRKRRSNTRERRSIGQTSSPLRVGPIRVIDPNQ
jgi:hypothetical protein